MSSVKREITYDLNKYKRDKVYSKKVAIYGSIGLIISAADYLISGNLGIDSIFKPFQEMNTHEIVTNLSFGLSSMSVLGGGIIYGLSSFFEQEDKKELNNKKNSLEKKL